MANEWEDAGLLLAEADIPSTSLNIKLNYGDNKGGAKDLTLNLPAEIPAELGPLHVSPIPIDSPPTNDDLWHHILEELQGPEEPFPAPPNADDNKNSA